MEFTKEQLEGMRKDPLMNFLASLLGTSMGELIDEAEKKSHTPETKPKEASCEKAACKEDELDNRIERFFNKMIADGKATVKVEDEHPHYTIKNDGRYKEPESPELLVEDNGTPSFAMSKEDLAEFINNYTKLENTFRKLEHAFGIDLNANADSIYTQYNAIVWFLIEKIFGTDNRDDIADYCFGDSNMESIEDLYEELV